MRRNLLVIGLLVVMICAYPVAAQDGSQPLTHIVQPDENLFRIALRYNVTVDALMRANGLTDADLVVVGTTLIIPTTRTAPTDLGILGAPVDYAAPPPDTDLGILPAGAAIPPPASAPVSPNAPPVVSPPVAPEAADSLPVPDIPPSADLGIIAPEAANWMLQPGIFSAGDAAVVREIYQRGQTLGNNARAFSKIGDCNSEPPFFLAKFDQGEYNLGPYSYLQPVIDQFAGSFGRQSMAVWTGNHAWALLDATWSNPAYCQTGETPIACEFRLNRPSMVLIRLGTNEAGSPDLFETNLRRIIEFSIERGVIPVLGTKADQIEGSDRNNEIVRALAGEYGVPLWDFGRVAGTLPARGLLPDGFHMSYVPPDYTMPAALQTGHSVQNLMALMALNTVWRSVMNY
jgi:hypothetical protein